MRDILLCNTHVKTFQRISGARLSERGWEDAGISWLCLLLSHSSCCLVRLKSCNTHILATFVEHGDGDIDVGDYDQLGGDGEGDPRQQEEECG